MNYATTRHHERQMNFGGVIDKIRYFMIYLNYKFTILEFNMAETKQLLILGNGFDLHCGIESSYQDFFESKILDLTTLPFGIIQTRLNNPKFWENLMLEYYRYYNVSDYNWYDIEGIIKTTLWEIFIKNQMDADYQKVSETLLDTAIDNVKSNIGLNNIKIRNSTTNNCIYEFIIKYLMNYFTIDKTVSCYSDNVKESIIRCLLLQLNNFENYFCKYLKHLIINPENDQEIRSGYIFKALNLLVKLTSNYTKDIFIDIKEKMLLEDATKLANQYIYTENNNLSKHFSNLKLTNILSFNYTNVFDILQIKNLCSYTNVHGKLCSNNCKNCKCSNIIFGIDDTAIQSQNEIPELRLFSKTYRKMQNTTSPVNILPVINNEPLEIKFYGHSLSRADYSYFQSIFDYYNIYDNKLVSLIFYYSKGFEQFNEIYDLINIYGSTLNNKDQGKNLMHKLLLENRLKIVEIE